MKKQAGMSHELGKPHWQKGRKDVSLTGRREKGAGERLVKIKNLKLLLFLMDPLQMIVNQIWVIN